jgi:predicted RNA-binding Zn ribbon-like protein
MTEPTSGPASDQARDAAAAADQAAEHIRELTEQFIDAAKKAGNVALDAYEKSLQSLVDLEQQAAGASQLEWVSNIAQAHAKFVQDVSSAYVSAARDMLK